MKINEIKLNEYDWLNLLRGTNEFGSAYLAKGPGETTRGHLTQAIFVKEFLNNAVTGLESAIQSGLVDVQKSPVPKAQASDFEVPPPKATAGDIGNYNQPRQTTAAPTTATKAQPSDISAQQAVDARMQRASTIAAQQAVDTRLQRADQLKKAQDATKVKESKYKKLNAIFEAIINEDGTQTVEEWIKQFFTSHMRNIDLTGKEQAIDANAKQIAKTIQQNKGNVRSPAVLAAIKNLGNLGYTISISDLSANRPVAAPVARQATAAPATTTVAKTPAPAQTVDDNVSLALKALGYKDKELKDLLPRLTAVSDEDKIKQALNILNPKAAGTTSTQPDTPDVLAGDILKSIDKLQKISPEKHKELLQVAANMHSKLPNDKARDDLAAARRARQQSIAK